MSTCLIGLLGKFHEIMFVKTWHWARHELDLQTFVFVLSSIIYTLKPLLNNTIHIYLPSSCYIPTLFVCQFLVYGRCLGLLNFFFLRKTSGPRLNISSHKWAGRTHSCRRLHQASWPQQLPSDIPWSSASVNLPGAHPGSPPLGVICHTRNMPNDQQASQEMTCACPFKMELNQQDV